MAMSERQRGRDPNRFQNNKEPQKEEVLPEYRHAVRFTNEPASNTAYEQTRDILITAECELSTYRTLLLPDMSWHVLVIGKHPDEETNIRIVQALSAGEEIELPDEVWITFNMRRLEQNTRGRWVEHRAKGRRRL